MFSPFKRKLDRFRIDVFTEDRRGIERGKHVEVTKTAKKHIQKITTRTGQIIRVEISNV